MNKLYLLALGIMMMGIASAWTNNTFTNNLNSENLTSLGNENFTRYLAVPSYIPALSSAYINITGYNYTSDIHYAIRSLKDWGRVINWNGFNESYYGGIIYANATNNGAPYGYNLTYTIRINETISNVTFWHKGVEGYFYGFKIYYFYNDSTISADTTYDGDYFATPYAYIYANSNNPSPSKFVSRLVFQSSGSYPDVLNLANISFNIKNGTNLTLYPKNINVTVGNSQILFGNITTTNSSNNFFNLTNLYLNSTYLSGSNYLIPFNFHSDTMGIIKYSGLFFEALDTNVTAHQYNYSTYETTLETFSVNVSYDPISYSSIMGILNYGGNNYTATRSGTGSSALFNYTLSIPEVSTPINKSFYWLIGLTNSSGVNYINTSTYNQTVNPTNLSICTAGINMPYINFTFKDETTNAYINASSDLATWSYNLGGTSKSYIFTNTTENPSYAFCFSPQDKTISETLNFQYSAAGYPQRQYYLAGTLTNSTTNRVLYLLSSANGIYSSFQVTNTAGGPISGATVQVERQFSGTWTLISQGTTDSSGLVTFWLNPNYDHRLITTKTGYGSSTVTIRPTQSLYTIILGGGSVSNGTYSEPVKGIKFTKTPATGILTTGTYNFTFNVTASKSNMILCKMELLNESKSVIDSSEIACTSNGFISIEHSITPGQSLYGAYYVNLGSGYIKLEGDANWKDMDTNKSTFGTIKDILSIFADSDSWYDNDYERGQYEFTKIVAFFLIFALIVAYANYYTGFDSNNPGMFLIVFPIVVSIMSYAGSGQHGFFYLSGMTPYGFMNNYLFAFYTIIIAMGYYFSTIRREG